MPATPTFGFRYPQATDPVDIPTDIHNLASDVENTVQTLNVASAVVLNPTTSTRNAMTVTNASLVTTALGVKWSNGTGTTDAFNRFSVRADGRLQWGQGDIDVDTNLYRGQANTLQTDSAVTIAGPNLTLSNTNAVLAFNGIGTGVRTGVSLYTQVAGEGQRQYQLHADGRQEWGPGGATALDTNLYRSAAGVLKTDNKLEVNTFRVGSTSTNGYVLTSDASGNASWAANSSTITIQDEGTPLTARSTLNFVGATVAATDNPASNRTDITVSSSSADLSPAVILAPTTSTRNLIQSSGNNTTLILRGQTGQAAPLIQFQDSTTAVRGSINPGGNGSLWGNLTVGSLSPVGPTGVQLGVQSTSTANVQFGIGAVASQTANILEFYDSANALLWVIGPAGIPRWAASANAQTTVGAAGGASALPATPVKYLKVKDSAGTTYVIPAYNP